MADLTDRHYGLFANNQHPIQLMAYQHYNQFLQQLHSVEEAKRDEALQADMSQRMQKAEEQLDTKAGETLSIEDMEDIYMDAKADQRSKEKMARNVRGRDGEINDYLEFRRPYGAASQ